MPIKPLQFEFCIETWRRVPTRMSGFEFTSFTASSIAILATLPITELKLNIEPILTTSGFSECPCPKNPRQRQDKNKKDQSSFIAATKTEEETKKVVDFLEIKKYASIRRCVWSNKTHNLVNQTDELVSYTFDFFFFCCLWKPTNKPNMNIEQREREDEELKKEKKEATTKWRNQIRWWIQITPNLIFFKEVRKYTDIHVSLCFPFSFL